MSQGFHTRGALVALVLAAAASAGCARYTDGTLLSCPRTMFVAGTERLTLFGPGAARSPESAAVEIQLTGLQYSCRLSPQRALATISFRIDVARRDAGTAGNIDVPYFVVVTDAAGNILVKHQFAARVPLVAGTSFATLAQEIEETLPLSAGQRAAWFEILVGVQISPLDLDYNLARGR